VLDKATAEAILHERLRRSKIASTQLLKKVPSPMSDERREFFLGRLHAKQRAFVEDPAKQKAACVASRGGKTTGCMIYAAYMAEQYPNAVIPYIVPESRQHAQHMFWRPMQLVNEQLQLGLTFLSQPKQIVFPNQCVIQLLGAHDDGSEASLRGIPFPFVILDECKDFGDRLDVLLKDAIIPRLDDYDGTIALIGTPGNILDGAFYDITRPGGGREGWSVHRWDRRDNTHLAPATSGALDPRDIYAVAKARGYDITAPFFRREYLGEWCPDEAELAYPYDARRNGWSGILEHGPEWNFVIAADFGETDDFALVVAAFVDGDPNLYFVETFNEARLNIEKQCGKIMEFYAKYKARGPVVGLWGDSGGYGKSGVTLLQERYHVPIMPVEKAPHYKAAAIADMRSDFITGRIKAVADTPLTKEWGRVNKDPKTGKSEHSDLGDAGLYAFKGAQHYLTPPDQASEKPRTATQAQELRDIETLLQSRKRDWWGPALSDDRE
jgi:hypothetical protein